MKIEKRFTVNAPQQDVWTFITAPEKVAPCIPGCEGAEDLGDGKYKAGVKVGIGPINTKFELDVEAVEMNPPSHAVYSAKGDEGGKASRIKSETTLSLASSASGTEVHYVSEVSIVGRLGKFGSGLVNKVADSIGEQFVSNLKSAIETSGNAESNISNADALSVSKGTPAGLSSKAILVGLTIVIAVTVAVTYLLR